MKIFICWSGPKSKKYAEVIRDWLPAALQFVKPYFTEEDIDKGARWSSDIAHELDTSDMGIICLTRDNIRSPWINFEAGALAKKFDKTHVSPILFGVESTDITGPMIQFQHTKFEKSDIKKLVKAINRSSESESLEASVLNKSYEKWWPDLEESINEIMEQDEIDEVSMRGDRELLEEILSTTRGLKNQLSKEPRRDLSGNAIFTLYDAFYKTYELVDNNVSYSRIMDSLEDFRGPLNYLAKGIIGDNAFDFSKINKINSLTFSISVYEDDIPF